MHPTCWWRACNSSKSWVSWRCGESANRCCGGASSAALVGNGEKTSISDIAKGAIAGAAGSFDDVAGASVTILNELESHRELPD